MDRNELYNPVDAGGEPEYPEKNLRKQVWTGNLMDIQRRPGIEPGLTGPQRGGSTAIRYTCFPILQMV